jgi:hypothetical protein
VQTHKPAAMLLWNLLYYSNTCLTHTRTHVTHTHTIGTRGRFVDAAGATKSLPCPATTYADKPGSASCLSCPTPISSQEGSSACSSCILDYHPSPTFEGDPVDSPSKACKACDTTMSTCNGHTLPIPNEGYWCVLIKPCDKNISTVLTGASVL